MEATANVACCAPAEPAAMARMTAPRILITTPYGRIRRKVQRIIEESPFLSGFVSIVGRPNAGKSPLLNALLGQKLAIVTHKPQTTRTRVHGVLEVPLKKKTKGDAGHPAAQVVLVDTPGIHKPDTQLDRRMMQ